jgi:hypothetical protein
VIVRHRRDRCGIGRLAAAEQLDHPLEVALDTRGRDCGRAALRCRALVGLALDFSTWRRLDREGLDDSAAAALMAKAVAAVGRA